MAITRHELFVFQPVGTCVLQQSAHRPCVQLQHSQAITNFTQSKEVRTRRDGWQRSALSQTSCMSPDFHNQLSQYSGSLNQHTSLSISSTPSRRVSFLIKFQLGLKSKINLVMKQFSKNTENVHTQNTRTPSVFSSFCVTNCDKNSTRWTT